MPDSDGASISQFAAAFPARFADALADARGAMAGISASAVNGNGLIGADALRRLHEIYRLRVELEIETAGVLWRTAEVVCALTDAIEVLNQRRRPTPLPPAGWLGALAGGAVERRSARVAIQDERDRHVRWPDLAAPASTTPEPHSPVPLPDLQGNGRGMDWRHGGEIDAEAA